MSVGWFWPVCARAEATAAINAGDTAWVLVSSALVLMMTAPGLALFYGGLVRRKNVLGTVMHSFILLAMISVQWVCGAIALPLARTSEACWAVCTTLV